MPTAVLISGGLDSAVLLAEEAHRGEVQPIYVSVGLAWEHAERSVLSAFLAHSMLGPHVRPLVCLSVEMRDVYTATHWAVEGRPPTYHTPDEDVYIPGRNIILLGKAGVFCAAADLDRLVLGTLGHNPFPDATPSFRAAMAEALSLGLAHPLQIEAPYSGVGKSDIIRRGAALAVPFELTLSCMAPIRIQKVLAPFEPLEPLEPFEPFMHCGLCSKCRERHDAFLEARVADPTQYSDERHVRA